MCRIDVFGRTSVQCNVEGGNGSDGEGKQERKEEDTEVCTVRSCHASKKILVL
jgi:hypothetical protein